MKARILTGLSFVLMMTCVSVGADDTPAQAAARAALEQEFSQLDHTSDLNTNVAVNPADSDAAAVNKTNAPGADISAAQPSPEITPAAKATAAPPEAASLPTVPSDNTGAQTAAFAALKQRMDELNAATNQPASATSAVAATVQIPPIAPARDASVAATPITETPGAESPPAKTPAIGTVVVTPGSVPPAVVAPSLQVATAPATVAAPRSDTAPSTIAESVKITAATPSAAPAPAIGLPKSLPGKARPTNELVTTSGTTYKNVEVERIASDGIFISYTPMQGGWAMTKVPFEDLPAELRQIYQK